LWLIFFSVLAVALETVDAIAVNYGQLLNVLEWVFTILFTIEYILRLWVSRRPIRYALSFYGLIDLLSCLPILRIFRVLKMVNHVRGASILLNGLRKSRAKITVFFFSVLVFAVIAGTLMYFIEGGQPNTKFTSIPMGH